MFAQYGVTKLAGTALVAGALGLAALATAGTAGALSSVDDTFLTQIAAEGIGYDSPKDAIYAAHDVCLALDDGADPVDLGMEIMENSDLTTDQAAALRRLLGGQLLPRVRRALRIRPLPRGGPVAAAGPPHPSSTRCRYPSTHGCHCMFRCCAAKGRHVMLQTAGKDTKSFCRRSRDDEVREARPSRGLGLPTDGA